MTNLLPIATWFDILGFHPWHAFGIAGTGDLAVTTGCDTLVRRYEWQNSDAAGSKSITDAIEKAEQTLMQYLGYSPAPHYVTETFPWPPLASGDMRWGAQGSDWRWLSVQANEGQIRAVGIEAHTLISANSGVTYSDEDGDTFDDTFTISAASSVTDASQIAVYFSVADRFNGFGATTALSERWRVRPITVTISGGVITVKGAKQLCVRPIKYEGVVNVGPNGLDPTLASNFVTTLDLYQNTTDPNGVTVDTSQAVITWETRPCHGWWCCCSACVASTGFAGSPYDPAAVAQAVARVGIRDARRGMLTPAEASFDSTTGIWSALDWTVCTQPDRVTIRDRKSVV